MDFKISIHQMERIGIYALFFFLKTGKIDQNRHCKTETLKRVSIS